MGRGLAATAVALCALFAVPAPALAAWPTIVTLAGTGSLGFSGDGGPAVAAQLNNPTEAFGLPGGSVLISDYDNNRVRLVGADGTIATFAGTGVDGFSGDGGPATLAQLSHPRDTIRLADGSILIADSTNERIRRVAADGTISTVAGTGASGSSGDGGPAILATFSGLRDLALLADGSVLISDQSNDRVRRIDTGGLVHAHSAGFGSPEGIEQVRDGAVLVADLGGQNVKRVAPDGTMSDFAGSSLGLCVDDLAGPQDVAELPDGSVLVADTFNNRVVRVAADGSALTVFAGPTAFGDCAPGFQGDGGARTGARFSQPEGVSVTPDGSVLVSDTLNHRIRLIPRVPPAPQTPLVEGLTSRDLTVPVSIAAGSSLADCRLAIRPAGSGAGYQALATTTDPAGRCTATADPRDVPDGAYELQVLTTDSDHDVDEAVFTVRIGPPATAAPASPGPLVPPPSFFVPCVDDGVLIPRSTRDAMAASRSPASCDARSRARTSSSPPTGPAAA